MQRDDLDEADPASVQRTLRAFEHLVQDDPHREIDFVRFLGLFTPSLTYYLLTTSHLSRISKNMETSGFRIFAAWSRIRVVIRMPI